ncbi:MAG: hypothetical protein IJ411_03700 [Oscillospiraceae bacterium]|nr:hypothetical protein [Oscillospiraceae bacterium]
MQRVWTWISERKKQCIYLAVASVLLLIGVGIVMQKGIYIESVMDKTFYHLESSTETERVFHGTGADIVQKGFFPNDEQVFITVTQKGQEPVLWTLTMNGKNENGFYQLIASDGKTDYEGTYSGSGNNFYFDDWEKYSSWDTVSLAGNGFSISSHFQSEDYIGSLLKIAYGDTDKNNLYGGLLFLYVIMMGSAYLSLFHAQAIFDWNKQWEFSFRNREYLEPSDWYFLQHKIVAVMEIAFALWLWLVATGIWKIS